MASRRVAVLDPRPAARRSGRGSGRQQRPTDGDPAPARAVAGAAPRPFPRLRHTHVETGDPIFNVGVFEIKTYKYITTHGVMNYNNYRFTNYSASIG